MGRAGGGGNAIEETQFGILRLQETKERMAQAQEELQEMQNEFEMLAGGKSDKFRELKGREQQMDTFLVLSFPSLFSFAISLFIGEF